MSKEKDKQDLMYDDVIPNLNGNISQSRTRGIFTKSSLKQPIDLLNSAEGKITSLLVTLPYPYLKKEYEPYSSYVNIIKEIVAKFDNTQFVLVVQTEYGQLGETEQANIDKIKSCLKNGSKIFVVNVKQDGNDTFSIWSQDAFLIAKSKNTSSSILKYLIEPCSHQRNNRRNDGSIAKGVIAESTLSYTPLNFPTPLEGGNVLVADDFVLIGQDEIVNSGFTCSGFYKKFQTFFGDEKPLITIFSKRKEEKKPIELRTRSAKRGGDTRELFLIETNDKQFHHDIYRWRGKEQPLFHIDLFITLLGRNKQGKQLILVGEPIIGFDIKKLNKHEKQLFDYQFDDVKERIEECLQNLKHDLNQNDIQYEIIRNPLPMTYYRHGFDMSWYWASYNNSLVEVINADEKTIWLPRYGTNEHPRNLQWNDLKKYDQEQVDLLQKNDFQVHLFNHDFHFLARKSGSLHCMTKCLYRSNNMGQLKTDIMSESKIKLEKKGDSYVLFNQNKETQIKLIGANNTKSNEIGCKLKMEGNNLTIENGVLDHASFSVRLLCKDVRIGIDEGNATTSIVIVSDFRERSIKEEKLTFILDKTWASFHIEREDQGIGSSAVNVDYLVINSKPV